MKKAILIVGFFILVITTLSTGCGNNDQKPAATPAQTTKEQYRCPMKCTDELFDKPGKCPVCDMDLEKVTKS